MPTTPNREGEVTIRDLAFLLYDLPSAHLRASQGVLDVTDAVRDTKKAGSVTVTFKIAPGKLDDSTIEILPEVTVKVPQHALKGGVFYPDDHGNPTKNDPSAMWQGDDIRSAPTFREEDETTIKGAPSV